MKEAPPHQSYTDTYHGSLDDPVFLPEHLRNYVPDPEHKPDDEGANTASKTAIELSPTERTRIIEKARELGFDKLNLIGVLDLRNSIESEIKIKEVSMKEMIELSGVDKATGAQQLAKRVEAYKDELIAQKVEEMIPAYVDPREYIFSWTNRKYRRAQDENDERRAGLEAVLVLGEDEFDEAVNDWALFEQTEFAEEIDLLHEEAKEVDTKYKPGVEILRAKRWMENLNSYHNGLLGKVSELTVESSSITDLIGDYERRSESLREKLHPRMGDVKGKNDETDKARKENERVKQEQEKEKIKNILDRARATGIDPDEYLAELTVRDTIDSSKLLDQLKDAYLKQGLSEGEADQKVELATQDVIRILKNHEAREDFVIYQEYKASFELWQRKLVKLIDQARDSTNGQESEEQTNTRRLSGNVPEATSKTRMRLQATGGKLYSNPIEATKNVWEQAEHMAHKAQRILRKSIELARLRRQLQRANLSPAERRKLMGRVVAQKIGQLIRR